MLPLHFFLHCNFLLLSSFSVTWKPFVTSLATCHSFHSTHALNLTSRLQWVLNSKACCTSSVLVHSATYTREENGFGVSNAACPTWPSTRWKYPPKCTGTIWLLLPESPLKGREGASLSHTPHTSILSDLKREGHLSTCPFSGLNKGTERVAKPPWATRNSHI